MTYVYNIVGVLFISVNIFIGNCAIWHSIGCFFSVIMLTTQNKVIHFMYNSEYIQTEIRNQFDKVISTESRGSQTASEMVKLNMSKLIL